MKTITAELSLEQARLELDELHRAGVKLHPSVTPERLVQVEDAGQILNLETGEVEPGINPG